MVFKNLNKFNTNKQLSSIPLGASGLLSKTVSGWDSTKNFTHTTDITYTGSVVFENNHGFSVSFASNEPNRYSEYIPWNSLMGYIGAPYNNETNEYEYKFDGTDISQAIIIEFDTEKVQDAINVNTFSVVLSGSSGNSFTNHDVNGFFNVSPTSGFTLPMAVYTKDGASDYDAITNKKYSNLSPSYDLRSSDDKEFLKYNTANNSIEVNWDKGTITRPYGIIYPQHGLVLIFPQKILQESSKYSLLLSTILDDTNSRTENTLNSIMMISGYGSNKKEKLFLTFSVDNDEFIYTLNPSSYDKIQNELLKKDYWIDNPKSFITQVGIYNDQNELLMVANLSKPRPNDSNTVLSYNISLEL